MHSENVRSARPHPETMHRLHRKLFPRPYDLKKIWHPEWFQGSRKKKNYFEGWYIKNVQEQGNNTISFIPGISLSDTAAHCFVQAINGKTGQTWYFAYPLHAFRYHNHRFSIAIGNSLFSDEGLLLDLENETDHITGSLSFSGNVTYPVSLMRPGIMGWYRYAPFMQCYHGVVSLNHDVDGSVAINGQTIPFRKGKGYIEKDWGSSMPEAWIWMQSNNFDHAGSSFMLSIAKVPWLSTSFTGFLGFLLFNGKQKHFATYTGAVVKHIEYAGGQVTVCLEGKDFFLNVRAEKPERIPARGALKAPLQGHMERVIHESVDSQLVVALTDKKGRTLFRGTGSNAGFETVGDISLLQP